MSKITDQTFRFMTHQFTLYNVLETWALWYDQGLVHVLEALPYPSH